MNDIQVNYDQLRSVGKQFEETANVVRNMEQNLVACLDTLKGGGWIADSARDFAASMDHEVLPGVERLREALLMAHVVVDDIIRLFSSAEEEAGEEVKADGGIDDFGMSALPRGDLSVSLPSSGPQTGAGGGTSGGGRAGSDFPTGGGSGDEMSGAGGGSGGEMSGAGGGSGGEMSGAGGAAGEGMSGAGGAAGGEMASEGGAGGGSGGGGGQGDAAAGGPERSHDPDAGSASGGPGGGSGGGAEGGKADVASSQLQDQISEAARGSSEKSDAGNKGD